MDTYDFTYDFYILTIYSTCTDKLYDTVRYIFFKVNYILFSDIDIVHENLKMGSDGESDQASGTSSDEVQSPTGVCLRNRIHRRISMEVTV